MAAARLWWLLNYYGFTRVAILDGGFLNWLRKEYPVSSQIPLRKHTTLDLRSNQEMLYTAQTIREISRDKNYKILDARAHIRYLGLEEVIDTSGGHIPGAISAPAAEFLDEDMYFKPIDEIKSLLIKLLGDTQPQNTVYYCGSGVAAALGVFAMVYAGYKIGRLFPGSWSEWIKQPWAEIAVHEE
jgi:thiosulfate/3-mercaptopyruvate sulfurtransferase